MKILALETSARAVSAAVSENGRILTSGYQDTGLTHSRTLMPIVEHILKNADLKPADMDAIAVAVGPGSFTGTALVWLPQRDWRWHWTSLPLAYPRWQLWRGMWPLPMDW